MKTDNPNTKKPIAFITLHSGWTFIKIPKHDMILGVQTLINKCYEELDGDGKNILVTDSLKPSISFNTSFNVQLFTNEEYIEHMSLMDKGLAST